MVSTAMAQNSIWDAIALALEPHWQTSKRPVKKENAFHVKASKTSV